MSYARLHAAARKYASRWAVFPLKAGGKQPATEHGCKDATRDLDQIDRWWTQNPAYNIGVATGEPSGIWVLDLDGDEGIDALIDLGHGMPGTLTANTPGGGLHLLFTDPGGLGNTASKIGPNIDSRGTGGYIVVAPSLHPNGREYRWAVTGVDPEPMPDWLLDLVTPKTVPVSTAVELRHTDELTPYGRFVLDAELVTVAQAREKTRNDQLFRSAIRCFELTKGGQIPDGYARSAFTHAAKTAGLTDDEIVKTLDSAWSNSTPTVPKERSPDLRVVAEDGTTPNDAEVGPGRFPMFTLNELHNIPQPEWLVDGYITDGLTLIFGPSGAGKSFVALDWALSIASATPWLGAPVAHRPVVYVMAEGSGGIERRADAWIETHSTAAMPQFQVIPAQVNMLSSVDAARLEGNIAEAGAGVVIIDTLARCMEGGDENAAEDLGRVIANADRIRQNQGCAVILVHHSGVDGSRPRGSTSLFGACDTVVKITCDPDPDDGPLTEVMVTCNKQKDGVPFPRVRLVPMQVRDSIVLTETRQVLRQAAFHSDYR